MHELTPKSKHLLISEFFFTADLSSCIACVFVTRASCFGNCNESPRVIFSLHFSLFGRSFQSCVIIIAMPIAPVVVFLLLVGEEKYFFFLHRPILCNTFSTAPIELEVVLLQLREEQIVAKVLCAKAAVKLSLTHSATS